MRGFVRVVRSLHELLSGFRLPSAFQNLCKANTLILYTTKVVANRVYLKDAVKQWVTGNGHNDLRREAVYAVRPVIASFCCEAISLSARDGDCFVAEFTPLSAGLLAVTGNLQRKQPKTIFLPPFW